MFFKYFKLECALYGSGVNQTKITIKNALHGDNFVTEGNHKSNKWSSINGHPRNIRTLILGGGGVAQKNACTGVKGGGLKYEI